MYTHWAPLAHSFSYVSKLFSGTETGIPLRSESSHQGDDACDCIVYIFCILYMLNILSCIYVYMYIYFEKELRGL